MDLFTPSLRLTVASNRKSYALDATVWTPNSCYTSAGAALGSPGPSIPSIEGVTLNLVHGEGYCLQYLNPVGFHLGKLPFSEGKTQLSASVVLGGAVVGVSATPIPRPEDFVAFQDPERSGALLLSVNAWLNAQPPIPGRLNANIAMYAPRGGYSYTVKRVGPWGFTGRTLLLAVTAKVPEAGTGKPEVKLVPYAGPASVGEFDSVAVLFEDQFLIGGLEIIH